MKEESNKLVKKIEPKRINLEPDRYFSKAIKHIDGELTFNKSVNKLKLKKTNNLLFNNYNNYNNGIPQKAKELYKIINKNNINSDTEDNTYNNDNFSLNKISRIKRLSYLPKISPFIYNNNTSISIDYNKANEMGARGFKILCNNESDSIKEILFAYNDYNYNNIDDYNTCVYFNNVNDKLKNVNNKEGNNIKKEDEKNIFEYTNRYGGNEIKNIFDVNYIEKKKISKVNRLLKNKIDRIKIQNKKVYKILGQYKKKYFNNCTNNRIYKLNYNSIEKHIPNIILNTKTQRISPENYLNKSNYNTTINENQITKENKLFSYKLKNNKIRKNISNKILFSHLRLNNSQKSNKNLKEPIYNLKNALLTNSNINLMKINYI